MKKLIYLWVYAALLIMASCEQEMDNNTVSEVQNTKNVNVTGKWEVIAHNDSIAVFGPFILLTLNNSETNNDSITIQDSEIKFWKFQVKAAMNENEGTFESNLSNCELSEEGIGIKIANGIIVDSDSIYFEIQFEDDETPYGNTYHIKGHRVNG